MEIQLNLISISISIQCEKEYIKNCFRLMTGNDNSHTGTLILCAFARESFTNIMADVRPEFGVEKDFPNF